MIIIIMFIYLRLINIRTLASQPHKVDKVPFFSDIQTVLDSQMKWGIDMPLPRIILFRVLRSEGSDEDHMEKLGSGEEKGSPVPPALPAIQALQALADATRTLGGVFSKSPCHTVLFLDLVFKEALIPDLLATLLHLLMNKESSIVVVFSIV